MLGVAELAGLAGQALPSILGGKTDVRQNVSNSSLANIALNFSNLVGDGTGTATGSNTPRQSSSASSGSEPLGNSDLGVFGGSTLDDPSTVRDQVFSTGTTVGFWDNLDMKLVWGALGLGAVAALAMWWFGKKRK